jgi:hypothetical protein
MLDALLGLFAFGLPLPLCIAAFVVANRWRLGVATSGLPASLFAWRLGLLGLPVCLVTGVVGPMVPVTTMGDAARNTTVAGLMLLACAGAMLGAASLGQRRAMWAGVLAILLGGIEWLAGGVVLFLSNVPMGSPGRPLRRRGVPVLPRVRRGRRADRSTGEALVTGLAEETRRALAHAWEEDARYEAASVPAFAHLARDLAVARAPAALIAWARRAEEEEIAHARVCFRLASAYAGRAIGASPAPFAPLWVRRAETRSAQLERLAIDSLVDGCVGEGAAAFGAALAAERAAHPIVRGALERIAREEETHAELAWAILGWLLAEEPRLATVLSSRLERLARKTADVSEPAMHTEVTDLARHGRLSPVERKAQLHRAAQQAKARLAVMLRGRPQRPQQTHANMHL